jgi:GNAT superfamily N-acetyltransferase
MKILTFDELSISDDPGRALVSLAAFGEFRDRRAVELSRRPASWLAEYVGVFAVDQGAVVGQMFVERVPYTFPHGTETVSGIAGVTTRLDHARGGIARQLLEEVHRRERAAGIRHSILWTNRSWGAHRLYEKIGYRDVYAPPLAVRILPLPRHRSGGARVRTARRSDFRAIEGLHARSGEGRWGFAQRPARFARREAATGGFRAEDVLIALDRGEPSGYAVVGDRRGQARCGELVASSSSARNRLCASVEARASAGSFTFWDGVVNDMGPELRRRGYVVSAAGWFGLMASELGRERSRAELVREFGTSDPRFRCFSGDRF